MINIRLHHKGYFVSDPEPAYIRGETYEVKDNFNIDDISTVTFGQFVKDLGYPPNIPLWYLHLVEGFSSGLRQLHDEEDVITFIRVMSMVIYFWKILNHTLLNWLKVWLK
jgi:hypothetical protein